MTTAPTPQPEALADRLEDMTCLWSPSDNRDLVNNAAAGMRRLQAENERLLAQVHKLEMDALDLASENSILKRAEESELEARKPLPLSYRCGSVTSGIDGGATVSLHFKDMVEAEAWFVAITDQYDAALVDKSPNLQEPPVDKTANLQDQLASLPGITGGSS